MYIYNLGIQFNQIAEKFPDRIALKFSNTDTITYRILNNLVNKIARFLLNNEIHRGDVVALAGDKYLVTFATMIACLKIGAVYTIFDPASPPERLRKIINTSSPKFVLANPQLLKQLSELTNLAKIKVATNEIGELNNYLDSYSGANLSESQYITGSDPAYIMFTSGSTGFPKGAVMTHENVLNLIKWSVESFSITADEVLTNVNPLYFDNSVFDFYSALFSGASLVPFIKEQVSDARLLVTLIDDFKCTQWFSVPTLLIFLQTMKAVNENNLTHMKRIIFGGEGYPKAKLKKLFDLYNHRISFFNVYGPTECTCICSSYKISADDFLDLNGFPPLGSMINNFSYIILDKNNDNTPEDEFGELCLLGPNVGKGYYNDLDMTNRSFVQNPFNKRYRELIYKTGDIVRFNPSDGKIYIGGRKDNQIKHAGYRIELEEIETALSQIDYISQAAVIHGSTRGLSQIIAVVSAPSSITEKTVREDLKKIIPDYMIPNAFHSIKELPKNPSGKIDRRKLAELYV